MVYIQLFSSFSKSTLARCSSRKCPRLYLSSLRRSISLSTTQTKSLDAWIKQPKRHMAKDIISPDQLHKLYATLPTRVDIFSNSEHSIFNPEESLGYGHHWLYFLPLNPESKLRADGTDPDFCPPEPFTRRMWASGRITWSSDHKAGGMFGVGNVGVSTSTIEDVQKKGFKEEYPMVFVKQKLQYYIRLLPTGVPVIEEQRTHVYLPGPTGERKIKEVASLPKPKFSFTFLPTPTLLFRFSALTFNAHYIHLDKDYAQSEGYSERLVHGPLTALMMLETILVSYPKQPLKLSSFEYRAINPLVVNKPITINGAHKDDTIFLWAQDEDGTIGMTGTVLVES